MAKKEQLSNSQGDGWIDRRSLIKSVGAGAVGTSLTFPFSGAAGAQEQTSVPELQELGGFRGRAIIRVAERSRSYRSLIEALEDDGVEILSKTSKAYSISGSRGSYTVASFVIDDGRDDTEVSVLIPVRGDIDSKAVVKYENTEGLPVRFEEYKVQNSRSQGPVNAYELKKDQARGTSVSKNSTEINWNNSGSTPSASIESDSGISTTSSSPSYCPVESIACGTCTTIVTIVNGLSCSLETALICAVVTVETGIGPLACAAAVGVICVIITQFGVSNPQDVCEMTCWC